MIRAALALAVLAVAAVLGARPAPARGPRAVALAVVARPGAVPAEATGVVIGPGAVLTVAHAVASGKVRVVGAGPATVRLLDVRADLAVLDAPGVGGPPLRLDLDDAPGAATVAAARGPVAVRVVRRVAADVTAGGLPQQHRDALELAGEVVRGDSGAAVVRAGRVLGIVFARARGGGTAYAVAAAEIARVLAAAG